MTPPDPPAGSAAWLDKLRIEERQRINGDRLTSAQAAILAKEAAEQSRYKASHKPDHVYTVGYTSSELPITESRWDHLPTLPEAQRIRAERSETEDAAMDRWVDAVWQRIRYAIHNNEPLLDFLPRGPRRSWLIAVYGRNRPASVLRSRVHLAACVGLPVLLGVLALIQSSPLVAVMTTLAGVAVVAACLAKSNLAFVTLVALLADLGLVIGQVAEFHPLWLGLALPFFAIVVAGHPGFPKRLRRPWPKFMSPRARTAGMVVSVASALVIPVFILLGLAQADISSPVGTAAGYLCMLPVLALAVYLMYGLARCSWVGLLLLIRRARRAPGEATSATMPEQLVVGKIRELPIVHEFDKLYESVYKGT
jgi:hypothetical protein